MTVPDDVLHIGLNKTATTWLQQSVFSAVRSHRLLGRQAVTDRPVVEAVARMQSERYRAGELRAAVKGDGDCRPAIVSDEGLSSTLRYREWADFQRTAQRAHHELPGAKVLLVLRAQKRLGRSSHRQYVKLGGTSSLVRFLSESDVPDYATFTERYDLLAIYELYRDLFGADRVVVLPYENLQIDPAGFLDELCARLDLDLAADDRSRALRSGARNQSLSPTGTLVLRLLNRLVSTTPFHERALLPRVAPRSMWHLVRRFEHCLRLGSSALDRRLARREDAFLEVWKLHYVRQNARLADATGIALGSFGYIEA